MLQELKSQNKKLVDLYVTHMFARCSDKLFMRNNVVQEFWFVSFLACTCT